MYALVDCNNFYASCERLFQPHLLNKPVVVLSNNDGCVIARSDEAKALGIVMGTPAHMIKDVFKKHDIKVFSSNYTLYGDLSDRVMKTLAPFAPKMELYSIDEAFLDFSELAYANLYELGIKIRSTVIKNIGIPVSIGIAPTKTLAKMANRYAKKKYKDVGVYLAGNEQQVNEMLDNTQVADIFGIGASYSNLLNDNGFKTAKDVTTIPPDWMRSKMSVVGLRLWNELKGIPSIEWEFEPKAKKNICTSRSFGKMTNDYSIVKEAISNHAATCAVKLRKQNCVCKKVNVFIQTNPNRPDLKQYKHSITFQCETATNVSNEIIAYALKALDIMYLHDDYFYFKCGVMVLDLIPQSVVQISMFDGHDRSKGKILNTIMDEMNLTMGEGTVRMAVQRFEKRYKLRAQYLSKKYTTNIKDIIKVKS
ncbi:MAG: Y-family DNA polymerase [Bacteroidota bacterium]|nr:Y-family DNA polymerase [Bacteroidota bacterium]